MVDLRFKDGREVDGVPPSHYFYNWFRDFGESDDIVSYRKSSWQSWYGNGFPQDARGPVKIRMRSGHENSGMFDSPPAWAWRENSPSFDIVAYKVIK